MRELVQSGRVFELVLACLLAEILVSAALRAAYRRRFFPPDVLLQLCAAAGLVLAAQARLAGAWWGYTGLALIAALAAHGMALWVRWRPGPPHESFPAAGRAFSARS